MIFSPRQYSRLKSRLRIRYQSKWRKFRGNLRHLPSGPLKTWIKDHEELLRDYTNFNWFFLKQLETFLYLRTVEPKSGTDLSLSKDEEKIFDIWNNSEFADLFLKELNKRKPVHVASMIALRPFEQHLLTMGRRHIEKADARSSAYRIQSVMGERVRNGKISPLLQTTLHLDGKELELKTPSLKEMNKFSQKIDLATKLIRKFSPSSWERFVTFTDTIIPIKDKEFVSYSHQEFPGVSMINLYDRDFLDLMDDLLHENGHHHLNHYLNLEKLIAEPPDMIYYSPWRRSVRPLRGIYHAYFTFFWAFRLFSDLASQELENIWYKFSDNEKEKIYWRAVEEYHMLNFVYADLQWARKKGLISSEGWKIIVEQQRDLRKFSRFIPVWERKVKRHRKELLELKKDLRENKKKYKKS
ncbi:MAG: aKG-HExxH-type peptide beta-hydroxylase [Bacteriovoracaceae bacterium]